MTYWSLGDGIHDTEIVQETRCWNPEKGETKSMREKEDAADYKYFPDQDLLQFNSLW